tara:strand:+ start:34 stop:2289 length:2256 start_codon:yes stop_codon:yes gene_type:complete
MRVVALLSGGKDSVYCAARARALGHEVVAAANLHPPAGPAGEPPVQEMDSFTFQTVGHQAVAGIAACMGVPLFRRAITGGSLNQDLQYRRSVGDEVEDLRALLEAVQRGVPGGVEAVCSGAIRSDYQRTRVEAVCADLGLVPLAFLWRCPQPRLLGEMIEAGMDCAVVKVAALGLDPEKHLGKTLQQLQAHLEKLHALYGCHMCGEGGEYETLTLDSPIFDRGRLVVDSAVVEAEGGTGVGHWNITALHLEPKAEAESSPRPEVIQTDASSFEPIPLAAAKKARDFSARANDCKTTARCEGGEKYLLLSGSCTSSESTPEATQAAAHALLSRFEALLTGAGLGWANCVTAHLYLRDMGHFAAVNSVYCSIIPMTSPPSRCCVELPLDAGTPLLVDLLVAKGSTTPEWKDVLHVQSISHWAPSCIGPYSQASRHGPFHFLAGQLGLVPETMALIEGGWEEELPQALVSCESVARAIGTSLLDYTLGLTIFHSARAGLRGISCDVPGLDAVVQPFLLNALGLEADSFGESEYRSDDCAVGNHRVPPSRNPGGATVLYVQVPCLPKDASVEVQPFLYAPLPAEDLEDDQLAPAGLAGGPKDPSRGWHRGLEQSDIVTVPKDPVDAEYALGSALVYNGIFGSCWSGSRCADLTGACEDLAAAAAETLAKARLEWRHSVSCRVHCLPSVGSLDDVRTELQRAFSARGAEHHVPLQVAPCSALALGRMPSGPDAGRISTASSQKEGLFAAIHLVAVL